MTALDDLGAWLATRDAAATQAGGDVVAANDKAALDASAVSLAAAQRTNAALSEQVTALTAALAAAQAGPTPPPAPPRIAFGAYCGSVTPNTYPPDAQARVTALLGGHLPSERLYMEYGFGFGTRIKSAADIVTLSYKQVPKDVLAGKFDAAFAAEFAALAKFPKQTFHVIYEHEADNKVKNGQYTGPDYKAAHRRVAGLVKAAKAPNVLNSCCFMGWSLDQTPTVAYFPETIYPGDDVIDVIGMDCYWTYQHSAAQYLAPSIAWAKKHGKPLAINEIGFGLVTIPFTDAQWTSMMVDTLKLLTDPASNVNVVEWFETNKISGNTGGDWRLATHPDALALYVAALKRG